MPLTDRQLQVLAGRLNSSRVAHRRGDCKQLSYLEAYDVRAHLIRVFGYGGFDVITEDYHLVWEREYTSSGDNPRPMIEVAYSARVRLNIRDPEGNHLATYVECAVGQANVGESNSMRGDAHDNALKTAVSDAMKRCAVNLGNQFGISLYNDGSTADEVRGTLLDPPKDEELTAEARAALENSLGATKVEEGTPA
jgi:recombination DNA repair RAD52 pathway protein